MGHPVQTELAATDCTVCINGEQFRSILHHLLDNAREASRSEDGRSAPVLVSSRVSEAKVIVDVTDSGPGMEEAFIREELFRPFRSTKDHGFGIGAYQTREVLRTAGGDLTVISEKGVGTIMRMTLPLADQLHLIPAA
jgi:signal transduction histidine kinase